MRSTRIAAPLRAEVRVLFCADAKARTPGKIREQSARRAQRAHKTERGMTERETHAGRQARRGIKTRPCRRMEGERPASVPAGDAAMGGRVPA